MQPAVKRLLIVDDEPNNVLLLEGILEDAGYTNVRGTTRSTEVEHLLQKFQPDLLLLDLMMPAPDGFEVMARLPPAHTGHREDTGAMPTRQGPACLRSSIQLGRTAVRVTAAIIAARSSAPTGLDR